MPGLADLVSPLLVLGAGIVAALAVHAVARSRPRTFHRPHHALTWAMVAAAGAGAVFADVAPTGIAGVDATYRIAFAVVVTLAAGRARRHARLIAGACAAVGSVGALAWNVVGFVALGLAAGSSPSARRPARPLGVAIGALQAQVLLRLTWPEASYATALLAGIAAVVLVVSGLRHARRRERKPARYVLGGVAVTGFVVVVLLGIGLVGIQRDLRAGAQAADAGLDAVRAGETTVAVDRLDEAERRLAATDDGLRKPWMRPARVLPVVGRYLDAGSELTDAARAVVAPALESARMADGEALQIRNGRIDLAAVAALGPPLERTLAAVPGARLAVQRLEGEELPGPIARRVGDLDESLANAVVDGEFVLEALELVPQLLGADQPRRWFVLMQTPSEQRASGGIAGGYGELLIDDGQLELVRAGEANELNQVGTPWDLGPLAAEYDRFPGTGPERYFQNVTNVAHFPTVGRTIVQVYPQAGGSPVDGVISVDPRVLGALLSLTGSIEVPGWEGPITAENVERTLLFDQYQRLDQDEGGEFVTDTIEATFDRLQSTTLPAPARMLHTLSPMVQAQRIKLYSARAEEQALFEEMGVTGALPDVEGDFLQLVTLNNSANKIDWFQERTVDYSVEHDPTTGEIDAVATVTITNGAPAGGLSELLLGGLSAEPGVSGRSRITVEVLTALELRGSTVDDRPVRMSGRRAYDRNLVWTTLTLQPGQTVTIELHLGGLLEPGAPYVLDLGTQPVIRPDDVQVEITSGDGSASAQFEQVSARRLTVDDRP